VQGHRKCVWGGDRELPMLKSEKTSSSENPCFCLALPGISQLLGDRAGWKARCLQPGAYKKFARQDFCCSQTGQAELSSHLRCGTPIPTPKQTLLFLLFLVAKEGIPCIGESLRGLKATEEKQSATGDHGGTARLGRPYHQKASSCSTLHHIQQAQLAFFKGH